MRSIAGIALGALALAIAAPAPGIAGRQSLIEGPLTLGALTTQSVKFHVPGDWMARPRLEGRLVVSGGRGNDIEAYVLRDADLEAWEKGGTVTALHASGRRDTIDFDVLLPGPGAYVIVLSNRFSKVSSKKISGSLALVWDEDPSLPAGAALLSRVRFVDLAKRPGRLTLALSDADSQATVVLDPVGAEGVESYPVAVHRRDGEAIVSRTVGRYTGAIDEAGTVDLHGQGVRDGFIVGTSSDGAGRWRNLVVICPHQLGLISLSLGLGPGAPGSKRRTSANYGDARFSAEQSFLERIQSAYGGADADSAAATTGAAAPRGIFAGWMRDNAAVVDGPLTIRRLRGAPGDLGVVETTLTDGALTYTAIAGGGVVAYDAAAGVHYVVFHPTRSDAWPTVLERSGHWLAIGTRGEGVALVDLHTFHLKRIRTGTAADVVKTLDATEKGFRVNGLTTVEIPPE